MGSQMPGSGGRGQKLLEGPSFSCLLSEPVLKDELGLLGDGEEAEILVRM